MMNKHTRRWIAPALVICFLCFSEIEHFNKFIGVFETLEGAVGLVSSSTIPVVHPIRTNQTAKLSSVERSNNTTNKATSSNLPVVHPVKTIETARVSSVEGFGNATKDAIEGDVQKKDWFEKNPPSRALSKSCQVFENVCHSSGRWWYKPTEGARQPEVTLLTNLRGAPGGYPKRVRVFPSDVDARMHNRTCHESSIPNHLVMHSSFDNMLGEFYVRILAGLNDMARSVDNLDEFLEQTQLYLHMYDKNDRPMMDSHHAFTDAYRGHPLLDFKSLLDNTGCQCLPRLLLCGYRGNKGESRKVNGTVLEPGYGIFPQGAKKKDLKYNVYRDMRQMIRRRVIVENPLAQDDIKAYKEKVLRAKGVKADFDDWRLIGLAQRSGRRRWRNLKENENACDQALRRHKIMCTEINVEIKESYPYSQAITHGALDGLFGIHGAQLTEAIWMKPGSLIVEFLPWLQPGARMGGWTRDVKAPTPLGIIYATTDLNHIGYPLQRQSAPYCYDRDLVKPGISVGKCFRGNGWDKRDFIAPSESIIDSVSRFFVNSTASCENYRHWASENFVLYNIQCSQVGGGFYPHQFYWKTDLGKLTKYTNYSNDASIVVPYQQGQLNIGTK